MGVEGLRRLRIRIAGAGSRCGAKLSLHPWLPAAPRRSCAACWSGRSPGGCDGPSLGQHLAAGRVVADQVGQPASGPARSKPITRAAPGVTSCRWLAVASSRRDTARAAAPAAWPCAGRRPGARAAAPSPPGGRAAAGWRRAARRVRSASRDADRGAPGGWQARCRHRPLLAILTGRSDPLHEALRP